MPTPRKKKRILIVEDDPDICSVISQILVGKGFAVDLASNGRIGFEKLSRQTPDLILLDLMMPEMDGFTFRSKQEADPKLAKIPTVLMSAAGTDDHKKVACNGYIQKPFEMNELLKVVARCLRS